MVVAARRDLAEPPARRDRDRGPRFYTHGGVDPEGMARAPSCRTCGGGDTQGASTLTQQYVKNVLIEEATRAGDTVGRRRRPREATR